MCLKKDFEASNFEKVKRGASQLSNSEILNEVDVQWKENGWTQIRKKGNELFRNLAIWCNDLEASAIDGSYTKYLHDMKCLQIQSSLLVPI